MLSLCATEVTQHITTGIIPLRQPWTLTANATHIGGESANATHNVVD